MDKICVIGAGGHGREVIRIIEEINEVQNRYEILGFIDDNQDLKDQTFNGYPVLGGIDEIVEKYGNELKYVLGIGEPRIKKQLIDKLENNNLEWPSIIHPSVRKTKYTEIGQGTIIFPGCVLSVNVKLGDFVCVNTLSSISHDSIIDNYTNINPGAFINGNVQVRTGVYLGSGCKIIQDIKIGDWSIIGAGAVIIEDVPENVTVVGVPGEVIIQ